MKLNILTYAALVLTISAISGCTRHSEEPVAQNTTPATQTTPSVGAANTNPTINAPSGASGTATTPSTPGDADLATDSNGLSKATVVLKTNRGTIKFKFYPKDAPKTVKRFVELVQQKFYNGLTFHRIEPGFVVQTGDPKSKLKDPTQVGSGGSGVKLKSEFNGRKHVRGTVAMARAMDPDSADSQFYITLGTFPHLDNNYTVFGQVIDFGEKQGDKDVLDRIRQWDDIVDMHVE